MNIPYSKRYSKLEMAIFSTAYAYNLTPVIARVRSGTRMRLLKIVELILTCNYGFTDLSYSTRMNMPFELGLLLTFGKETFIVGRKSFSTLKTVSDLNFSDIHYHEGSVQRLISAFSRWIEQTCSLPRASIKQLMHYYRVMQQYRRYLGEDFDKLTPEEIKRLIHILQEEYNLGSLSLRDRR